MHPSVTEKSKATDFGKRLASRDATVRAAAEAELDQLGAAANDVLLAELQGGGKNPSSTASLWCIMLGQLPSCMNLIRHHYKTTEAVCLVFLALHMALALIILSVFVRGYSIRRGERSALALALAERGDNRVIEPFLQIWQPKSRPSERTTRIIAALTQLLTTYLADPAPTPFNEAYRNLIRGRLGKRFPKAQRLPHTDFSVAEADLLATFAQYLARTKNDNDTRLLARIAAAPTAQFPNRLFVQEVAVALRDATFASAPVKSLTQTLTHFTPVPSPTITQTLTNRRP